VQDPKTAIASSMPNTIIQSGIEHKLVPLTEIGKVIGDTVSLLDMKLKTGQKIKSN